MTEKLLNALVEEEHYVLARFLFLLFERGETSYL